MGMVTVSSYFGRQKSLGTRLPVHYVFIYTVVETDTQAVVHHKSAHPLVMKLPETLSVSKHHIHFV